MLSLAFAVAGLVLLTMIWLQRRRDVLFGKYIERDNGEK